MSNAARPLVTNAADEAQQEKVKDRLKLNEDTLEKAYAAVMATEAGQRVLWDLLEFCGTFRSIWEASAKIHHNAGKQDVGHYLQAKIAESSPTALVTMMQRAYTNPK